MKTKNIFIGILVLLLSVAFSACEDQIDPLIEELDFNRVFAPTNLTARVRNQTTIELTWNIKDDADEYVVEFSEDSLQFNTIIRTVTISPIDLPVQETFEGETRYSARVKGVSNGSIGDSKWTEITIMTDLENIYLPIQDGDIDATEATLRWEAGSEVTHFVINPGDVQRPITADEKAAGVATITDLTGSTEYTVVLRNNAKQRGTVTFTTLIDVGGATRVFPEDDLSIVIADAAPGDVLVLYPGDYTVYKGSIDIDKSLTIRGLYPYDKPLVYLQFSILDAAAEVELIDLDLNGEGTMNDVVRYNTADVAYGTLLISGCTIHDYSRSLVAGNVASTIQSVDIDNCIVTDVITDGGDFLDFRNTHLANLNVTNSTFNNCAPGRDFVRMDAAGAFSGTGLESKVLIDHCTLYGVSNSASRRILYVRFLDNSSIVRNTLIAETLGYYTNQNNTTQPECSNNNYFNAPDFYDSERSNAKVDVSGNYTTLDPGFTDALNGDFTITNQTLLDNEVGDPRWHP